MLFYDIFHHFLGQDSRFFEDETSKSLTFFGEVEASILEVFARPNVLNVNFQEFVL